MSSWNFPLNQGGQIRGVADAGIETFNGTELSSLARENCQNSLDAALDDNNPKVIVEFERYSIESSIIPGMDDYTDMLRSCKQYWDTSNSEKAKYFLKEALTKANQEKIFALRISDYNTTGLKNPYGNPDNPNEIDFDGWNALVKIDGGANKGDDKAGAFGIGKSAPFSNSYYRLVFYRTKNEAGEEAAQGISRLLSYPKDPLDVKHTMTTGVGYYGDTAENDPVGRIDELDALNKRDDTGTDVFIFGFKGSSEWQNEIVIALLDSFLMSIYYEHLQVRIKSETHSHELNKQSLGAFMERVHKDKPGEAKSTYGNYLALTRTEGVHTFSKDFHGLGTLFLRILVDPNEKLDRKILIVRKAGMKLFRLGNISKLVPFTGILELKGKALNSFFRDMETPAHDNWEPGRHKDSKKAKQYYEEIKEWIRDIVATLAEHSADDELEVQGLGGILQKEPESVKNGDSEKKKESLNDYLGEIDIIPRPSGERLKGFFYGQDDDSSHSEQVPGTLGPDGEPATRIPKGSRPRKRKTTHKGSANPNGKDVVTEKKNGGRKNCPLGSVRVIKQGKGSYIISFDIPHDLDKALIEIASVGENGKAVPLHIKSVSATSGCANAILKENCIEAVSLESAGKVRLNVTLNDSHDYAMEVNVYEHNQ